MRDNWKIGTCCLVILLGGCAAGPNYQAPKTAVAPAFGNSGRTNFNTTEIATNWWQEFHDEKLNDLVSRALAGNHDLRIATANVREARALRRLNQADMFPAVTANASYANNLLSKAALFGATGVDRHQELYDAGFDAAWELDLFGHVRRSVQASVAELQSVEADRRDVLVTLSSEVARNYFELRGAQNELGVAHRNADNQRETLNITQARLDGGRGTELDVARARAQLNSTLASIPPLETTVAAAIHRLSVLVGQPPTALVAELQSAAPLPSLPALVAIGDPEALLKRRPDVRAVERSLAAATARIGIATADLFPRVTFNGHIGLEAGSFSSLGQSGSETWSFGPRISWAALDLGHVRARIQASGARAEAALALYERTVLTALEETENALVNYGQEQTRQHFLRESMQASETAATLARQRYENGAADFLTVLDSERVLLEAQDQFARSQTRTATALVAVYKSLGGGPEPDPNRSAPR